MELAEHLTFATINLNDSVELDELVLFLENNYVESDDELIKFGYTKENIIWNYLHPACIPELLLCIRDKESNELIATVFGKSVELKIKEKISTQIEKSFLCVSKKFRKMGLSKVINNELSRRVDALGLHNIFYTSGNSTPSKFRSLRYYHKTINPRKMCKLWHIPSSTFEEKRSLILRDDEICRLIEQKDVKVCTAKLNRKLSDFDISYVFNEENFAHYFLPFGKTVYTYIIEKNGNITDMISIYKIKINVNLVYHISYSCGYLHYYFNESRTIDELLNIIFCICEVLNIDEFCMLELTEPNDIIKKCKVMKGTGSLHYYIDGINNVNTTMSIFVPML